MGHLTGLPSRASGPFLAVVLTFTTLTACGRAADPAAEATEASSAVSDCRTEWANLISDWETRAESGFPSDLAGRWTALAAGGAYQSSAADDSCEDDLDDARLTARAIERLSGSLRTFDLVWQYGDISPVATEWIADARRKPAKRAQRALDKLERLAPDAVADMDAVWQAAIQADLADPDAMRDLADSMAFVANDSKPWRQGSAALRELRGLVSPR